MDGVIFSQEAAQRIADTVRTVAGTPINLYPERRRRRFSGGAGFSIYWAKVTAVFNANSYTCDIYYSRGNFTAEETGKMVKVWDITDSLSVNDYFPVIPATIENFDYECPQQLGLL